MPSPCRPPALAAALLLLLLLLLACAAGLAAAASAGSAAPAHNLTAFEPAERLNQNVARNSRRALQSSCANDGKLTGWRFLDPDQQTN